MSGVEIAGLILGSFPLIISALEHYGEGLETMQEWVRFRTDFNGFLNDFIRQQIFFRQHIEDLLSTVVDSDYHMGCMLDDPDDPQWKNSDLEGKLKRRLPGKQEYESYMITVPAILGILEKIRKKLSITDDKPHWSQSRAKGLSRLSFEYKRVVYVLDRKRRARLMDTLERYNSNLQQLLGNSDRLQPTRRKRNTTVPALFEHFRRQASSLHNAIYRSLQCDCSSIHSSKLFLPETHLYSSSSGNTTTESLKLKVYFPRKLRSWSNSHTLVGPEDDWYAADIEMAELDENMALTSRLPDVAATSPTRAPSIGTIDANRNSRNVSFQQETSRRLSSASMVPKDAIEIQDLCAALKEYDPIKPHLGYLRSDGNDCHTLYHSQETIAVDTQWHDSVTLMDLIRQDTPLSTNNPTSYGLRRQQRLEIALTMAKVVLQLYHCPWLKEDWTKDDIYFFRDKQGKVDLGSLSLDSTFYPSSLPPTTAALIPTTSNMNRKRTKSSLLSLGILILEMWFNMSMDTCLFWSKYLGPDGLENDFTRFNTAQKWQEQALEEGGLDLDNLTYRCIHGDFGTAKQDLNEDELRKAVYSEVVEPLERILARYE
ncbi:hypothetical protein BU16DRAFT_615708 [Lophium mytilinum]|uniref:DUF7580 domain-containing protein n=1 Tax=Lophium mytilinum TaxID=390894 RepID=A0A6A6R429_9PEZI|nr:hypothetical protein BU16DRAFT_615708 [Lophium mytilinum]